MTHVVIFSDASIHDTEDLWDSNHHADKSYGQPAKSAGPYRIATEVRLRGMTCQVINLFFYFTEDEVDKLCNKFITDETIIVGFSTTFWDNPKTSRQRIDYIKRVLTHTRLKSSAKIVFGGVQAVAYSSGFKADACITGFGESAFNNFLDSVIDNRNLTPDEITAVGTPVYKFSKDDTNFNFNNSTIVYEPEDCLDNNESVVIEITRGCIFKCDFCAYPLNGKKKLDYIKEYNSLRDELIRNYELYNITNYTLSDDTFNDSPYKVEMMHRLFTSLPFKIKFTSYLRLDLLNSHREEIQQLKEMGLVGAFFGIESLNHNSAKSIGKGLDSEKVKSLLYDLKDSYWKNDVNVTIGLISGLPYETQKSHQDTLDWILNERECLVDRVRPAALNIPNPLIDRFPFKSEFQLNAAKYGYYWPDPKSNNWKNLSHYVSSREQAEEMSKEIFVASDQSNRTAKGNFLLLLASNLSKYNDPPLSLQHLCDMPRIEFGAWFKENRKVLVERYVSNYKQKILTL